MPRFAITDKAGRFVAAHRNIGVGMVLELTEKQAEHELRLGSLVALDTSPGPSVLQPGIEPAEPSPEAKEGQLAAESSTEAPRKVRRSKQ